jgi:hypothetical protein
MDNRDSRGDSRVRDLNREIAKFAIQIAILTNLTFPNSNSPIGICTAGDLAVFGLSGSKIEKKWIFSKSLKNTFWTHFE